MEALEAFLIAVIQALAPILLQQIQRPNTAQDSYSDTPLQDEIKNAIANPFPAAAD
jgi:hypothetical protein